MKKKIRMLLFLVVCCAILAVPLSVQATGEISSPHRCAYESRSGKDFPTYGSSCEEQAAMEASSACENQDGTRIKNKSLAALLWGDKSPYSTDAQSCKPQSSPSAKDEEKAATSSADRAPLEMAGTRPSVLTYGNLLRSYFAMLQEQYSFNRTSCRMNAETITESHMSSSSSPLEGPVGTPAESDSFAMEVVELVNAERAAEGLAPLTIDPELCAAAEIRAQEILGTFSHTRPNGSSCFTALDQVGAVYRRAGENIALGQSSAKQVVEDWMNSPGHRENIMNSSYSRIGVATEKASRGYGWAQFFAD